MKCVARRNVPGGNHEFGDVVEKRPIGGEPILTSASLDRIVRNVPHAAQRRHPMQAKGAENWVMYGDLCQGGERRY